MQTRSSPAQEFWAGIKAELPILVGVFPFGMIYGVLALSAGLNSLTTQAMSSIIFAGSSQFILTQMVAIDSPGLIMVITVGVVNLRHALYSASIAPYLQHLSLSWKVLLSYLLTDEAYAVTILHYQKEGTAYRRWFFLGAGLALWSCWQASTAAGIILGSVIPESWPLDFTLALTFIALLVPTLKDRPSLLVAVSSGLVAVAAYSFPYKLGLVLAAITGIIVGLWAEKWKQKSGL